MTLERIWAVSMNRSEIVVIVKMADALANRLSLASEKKSLDDVNGGDDVDDDDEEDHDALASGD